MLGICVFTFVLVCPESHVSFCALVPLVLSLFEKSLSLDQYLASPKAATPLPGSSRPRLSPRLSTHSPSFPNCKQD